MCLNLSGPILIMFQREDCRCAEWFGAVGGIADLAFMTSHTCHPSILQGRMEFPISAFSRPTSATLPDAPLSERRGGTRLQALRQCKHLGERIGGVRAYSQLYFGVDIHRDILVHSASQKRNVFD